MENLKIEYLSVDALTPYERNTRKHSVEDVGKIKRSIEKYGFDDPIGVWGKNNLIVEGHGRLMAAKELGMKEVPVIRLDHLTDEQRREYSIAHNRTAEFSDWDFDALKFEMSDLDFEDFDMGFDFNSMDEDFDIEDDSETEMHVIVKLNVPNVGAWNMIEDEIKRIASEVDASVAVKME